MNNTENQHCDVAIIGAGPVGLFAVFECGQLGLRCHVIDSLEQIGGQCSALYPHKPIYDIPAWPEISGQELIDKLHQQITPYQPEITLQDTISSMQRTPESRILLTTASGKTIHAGAVIIAAGGGVFVPKRPPIDDIESFENRSVFYAVRDPSAFADKTLVIAGGGDSALDWAIDLAPRARKIYLVHRREKFRGTPDSVKKLHGLAKQGLIELVVPYRLENLEGNQGALDAVHVATLQGEKRRIEADALLAFYGLANDLGPICDWGIRMQDDHINVDPRRCATSMDGVFAIGDVATYPGKLKLILSGFAEAALAAYALFPIVRPDENLRFQYSTTKGPPGGKGGKGGK